MSCLRPSIETKKKLTIMIHSTENVIRHKVGLWNLAEELNNETRTCKVIFVSGDTFFQLVAHAAKTRPLAAGTIAGSDTVSNKLDGGRTRGSTKAASDLPESPNNA